MIITTAVRSCDSGIAARIRVKTEAYERCQSLALQIADRLSDQCGAVDGEVGELLSQFQKIKAENGFNFSDGLPQ